MDNDIKFIYPLTIVKDRYGGAYSDGVYTAWNLDYYEIPLEVALDDVSCMDFWSNNTIIVGKGNTPEESIEDLYKQLDVADIKSETIKAFGKLLIDKAENGIIKVEDIPEYVIEMVGDEE